MVHVLAFGAGQNSNSDPHINDVLRDFGGKSGCTMDAKNCLLLCLLFKIGYYTLYIYIDVNIIEELKWKKQL